MEVRWFRGAWRFAGPYLALAGTVALYTAARLTLHPANAEFVGVYLVILGLPWSLLGAALAGDGAVMISLAVVGGITLNAWLLYRLGRRQPGPPPAA